GGDGERDDARGGLGGEGGEAGTGAQDGFEQAGVLREEGAGGVPEGGEVGEVGDFFDGGVDGGGRGRRGPGHVALLAGLGVLRFELGTLAQDFLLHGVVNGFFGGVFGGGV